MNKTKVFLVSVLSILILVFYSARILRLSNYSRSGNFTFDLPKIPLLRIKLQNINPEVIALMCGVKEKKTLKQSRGNKLKNKSKKSSCAYEYGEKDGISFVYRVSDPNYKWLLYGTAYKNTRPIAVFYNPKTLKLITVGRGDKIDKNLVVTNIKQDEVYIKNYNRIFKLQIFKISSRSKMK